MPKPRPLDPVKAHLEAGFKLRDQLEERRVSLLEELREIDQQLALLPPRPPAVDSELLKEITADDSTVLAHLCHVSPVSKSRLESIVNDWSSKTRVDVDKACKRLRRLKLAEYVQRQWQPTLLGRQAAEALTAKED